MSARQLAQVGLVLLGGYLIVSSLASIAESFSAGPLVLHTGDDPVTSVLARSVGLTVAASMVGALAFGVAPGIFIIRQSHAWSTAWIPEHETPIQISPSVVFQVGLLLLGIYMAIHGLASIIGGASQVLASGDFKSLTEYGFRNLGSGTVFLVGGIAVFSWGRRVARDAA